MSDCADTARLLPDQRLREVAASVYVLVAIVKKELNVERSLYEILQILSLTLFEKTSLFTALSEPTAQNPETPFPNQRTLFDL